MLAWVDDLDDISLSKESGDARVETVARRLGDVLYSGFLALFVGSGVSNIVHLPLWSELNARIVQEAPAVLKERFPNLGSTIDVRLPTPDSLRSPNASALSVLDRVEKVCSLCETIKNDGSGDEDRYVGEAPSWHKLVKRALYGNMMKYGFNDMFDAELVSLCSLLMGGRRGLVREVVTFNYDDLLESYLRLHGHACHVITPLPNRTTPNFGTTFYHPHGYLPLEDGRSYDSPFLVLSAQSYERVSSRIGDHPQLWRDFIAWMLCIRIGLLVGISGNDDVLKLYFNDALKLGSQSGTGRPLAFVILVGDDNPSPREWLAKRIVPLEFADPTAVASFLTLVCQRAATLAGVS